jgi:hypothetical protein
MEWTCTIAPIDSHPFIELVMVSHKFRRQVLGSELTSGAALESSNFRRTPKYRSQTMGPTVPLGQKL